jgi:hypothetical protein
VTPPLPDRLRPESFLVSLGVPIAPLTAAGVATAVRFFAREMPELPLELQLSFLRGMDLHMPVREVRLAAGEELAAFRYANQDPFRLFYTKIGASPHTLGINPSNRAFRRFRVVSPITALESHCASARETWSDLNLRQAFSGGGTQYVVPKSGYVLTSVSHTAPLG